MSVSNIGNNNNNNNNVCKVKHDSMENYNVIDFTTEEIDMLTDMAQAGEALKSEKFSSQVEDDREDLLAFKRVSQFKTQFNAFKGITVHPHAIIEDPKVFGCYCSLKNIPRVNYFGCKDCCAEWDPTVHQCDCKLLPLHSTADGIELTPMRPVCMHPGDFDISRLETSFSEDGLCLLCGLWGRDGGCEHTPLHDDCFRIAGRSIDAMSERYTGRLCNMLKKDAQQKIDEDASNTDIKKRKVVTVFERLDKKHTAWLQTRRTELEQELSE